MKVCIDDFALRKGHTYGTVMVDIDTHRIIDMIDSRETEDVTAWLKTYPNISVVSRDGSVSYNKAIADAKSGIIQISDRFHLLKGLTDSSKKVIAKLVSANFRIPLPCSHYDSVDAAPYWGKEVPDDLPTRKHNASVERKAKLVSEVREWAMKGYSDSAIADELGISAPTVKRYRSPDFDPAQGGAYNSTLWSKIKPYTAKIKAMLVSRHTFKEIEKQIRSDGYSGASSTIRMFATRERKLLKATQAEERKNTEKIEKKWLIRLLYNPLDKVNGITEDQLDRVVEKIPLIGKIYDVVQSFRETLFSQKPEKLEGWATIARNLECEEISSFVNGIERDWDAVSNAIRYEYSNGLAEGSVNKLKLAKRIMYGRSSFALLKSKVLQREGNYCIN